MSLLEIELGLQHNIIDQPYLPEEHRRGDHRWLIYF
jgi:hypothetical protein